MQPYSIKKLVETSPLDAGNGTYLEALYESYLKDPNSVPDEWKNYFANLKREAVGQEPIHSDIQNLFRGVTQKKIATPVGSTEARFGKPSLTDDKNMKVRELIDAYRLLGHLHAALDPLKMRQKPLVPELMLSFYHLQDSDLDRVFEIDTLDGGKFTLREVLTKLQQIYCGTIATEYMHIPDSPERLWVQQQVESIIEDKPFSPEFKKHLLTLITAAEGLEKYLGAKYPGAKRFSIEGNDTLIVALDEIIHQAGSKGGREIVIGMAHRGRLNILVNLFGKLPRDLFDEFEGKHVPESLETGDVKYHQGFSSDVDTQHGIVHISLAFNPSHLEIVNPVVCGSVRARQERRGDLEKKQVIPILLHGDAAFAGQGVVMEILNMSRTRAYGNGGTIHLITNNQIGFTTSYPEDARSTLYCSDIGKMIEVPIFHVNADDPEAVIRVVRISLEYRNKFKKDVIVNLVGYRRHGHNEADEPAATQPIMYQVIRSLPTVVTQYSEKLIFEGVITKEEVSKIQADYRTKLDQRDAPVARNLTNANVQETLQPEWLKYSGTDWRVPVKTAIDLALVTELANKRDTISKEFVLHPRVLKIFEDRRQMTKGEQPLDWGYGETLAYASLLFEGYPVRLTGQDVRRGTFFHRHAVVHNQLDGSAHNILSNLSPTQAKFSVFDSLLSEEAVLGFEYGYTTAEPKGIVIWEAQFGDFANGAQVVIDQFISSGEQKWRRICGLTLFLPHGYEGQGPEHSSARLERFLQLCAEQNIQVTVPSTPAQIFHLLRRQVLRNMRKPLIVISPKSLLRHKLAVSSLEDITNGSFMPLLPEVEKAINPAQVVRVVMCSGKVYYELFERRRELGRNDIALLRIEQLYPFPDIELKAELAKYTSATDIVWCQEEPQNQGAWYSSSHHFLECLAENQRLRYVGRASFAAPAAGYIRLHEEQQTSLVNEALS